MFHIRIKLINVDYENIENSKFCMYKILRYYKVQEDILINEYEIINPKFQDSFQQERYLTIKTDFTREFGEGYKRICQKKYQLKL